MTEDIITEDVRINPSEDIRVNPSQNERSMEFTIKGQSILKIVARTQGIADRKSANPVLSGVLLSIKDGCLYVVATNNDMFIYDSLDIDSKESGSALVNASMLYEILKRVIDDADVLIYLSNNELNIKYMRSHFRLATIPYDQFPSVVINDNKDSYKSVRVDANKLYRILQQTQHATAIDDIRPSLCGICMHADNNALLCVATDGHRFAKTLINTEETVSIQRSIIPRRTIMEIMKVIKDVRTDIKIHFSQNRVKIVSDRLSMGSRLIDAQFPKYENILPAINADQVMTTSLSLFKDAIDRVSLIASEKTKRIKLNLSENNIELSSISTDSGGTATAYTALEVSYRGKDMQINLNARYLLDVLNNIEDEEISICFTDPSASIRLIDKANPEYVYLIMPMLC